MKYWKFIAAVMTAAVLAGTAAYAEEETKEESPAEMIEIGEGGSDDDYVVVLTNESGKDITGIAIAIGDEEAGDNLLAKGEKLSDGAQAKLTVVPAPMDEVTFMPPLYNMELTFDDGARAVLHSFPFGDTESAVIRFEKLDEDKLDDPKTAKDAAIAWITYASSFLGSDQDTMLQEWSRIAPEKARAAAAEAGSGEGGSESAGDDDWCLVGGLLD